MTELHRVPDGAGVADFGYRPAPIGLRANMIYSADGAAAFQGRAGPLSSTRDHQLLLSLRAYSDVVLVGAGTARAEHYGPVRLSPTHRTHRRELGLAPEPPPVAVVSLSGRLPETLFGSVTPPILITCARGVRDFVPPNRQACEVLVAGDDEVDIEDALDQLRRRGLQRVLCEGGPTLLDELVGRDLVDELCVTLAPLLAGSQPLGRGTPAGLVHPAALTLTRIVTDADDYLYLTYRRGVAVS